MNLPNAKKLIEVFDRKPLAPPPLWMMRQAGRYLSEYREIRAKAGSFWKMCMMPTLAAEVTLQPVRRFGFDGAIVFSDILVVPAALGVRVEFEDGPKLSPVSSAAGLKITSAGQARYFAPVYEALKLAKAALDVSTALLGFAGGVWTLASYLAAGGGGDDQKAAKLWAYRNPESFQELVDLLVFCVSQHLIGQLTAGADAVQIFDSWASGLPPPLFSQWVITPTKKIVANVRAAVPNARVIGFPRAATLEGYLAYARETGVDAVSVDTAMPMGWAVGELGPHCVLQGNLDPVVLVAGGRALAEAVDNILEITSGTPFIFNLGHGILPETPVEHVCELVNRVRGVR
ncbi:MAG: uroporphyrinogen decarboxylase [Alphaproteobacteria bacterium]|nr:uroporphyrinogen decarboxylase [Alphaproteobacteria bacterium]MDE2629666.1 uroporphyrinogen decarboxylase [Alphaproteobacteria bacterium]